MYQSRESSKKGEIMKITKEVVTNLTQQSQTSGGGAKSSTFKSSWGC